MLITIGAFQAKGEAAVNTSRRSSQESVLATLKHSPRDVMFVMGGGGGRPGRKRRGKCTGAGAH